MGEDTGLTNIKLSNNKGNDIKACAFCGSTRDLTDDHIPPKNIFPKPRPNNLITVPACKKCNSSTAKDDEYFRLKLSMSQETGKNLDARKNRETVFRSLQRSNAKGLRNLFVNDLGKIQFRSPNGIYLGKGYIYNVDLNRIFNVIRKIVKGLYYYESSSRLSDVCEIDVYSNDTLNEIPKKDLESIKQKIIHPILSNPPKVLGDQTFSYRFQILEENTCFSVWILTFYGNVNFLSMTGPSRDKAI